MRYQVGLSRAHMIGGLISLSAMATSGCTMSPSQPAPAATAPTEELSSNKLEALLKADGMISEGIADKEKGEKLKAAGKDQEGDDLLKQGEAKVLKGQLDKEAALKLMN